MKKFILASSLSLLSASVMAGNLTDNNGMTLYTFDKDSVDNSNCYGSCAKKWPPFVATEGVELKKGWGVIERKDGIKQLTFNGKPLYTWIGDQKVGDATGDGVGGVWHVASNKASGKAKAGEDSGY